MSVDIKINFFSSEDADSVNIYRDTPTIDVNNLPSPIANVASSVREYQDTGLQKNTTYQYVVGSVYGLEEKVSDVIDVNTAESMILTSVTYVSKFDQNYNLFFYDLINTLTQHCYASDVDSENNLYAIGGTNIVKTDKDNNLIWEYVYNAQNLYGDCIVKSHDGFVYAALRDGRVLKIDDTDGSLVWENTDHTDDVVSIAVSFDGNVYTASYDDTVKKILPNGTTEWTFNLFTNSVSGICIDEDENIYAHSNDNTYRKISPSGTEIWYANGNYLGYTHRIFYRANTGTLYLISNNVLGTVDKLDGTITPLFNLNLYSSTQGVTGFHVFDNGNVLISSVYVQDDFVRLYDPSGNILHSGTQFGSFNTVTASPGRQSIQLGLHS